VLDKHVAALDPEGGEIHPLDGEVLNTLAVKRPG
jgi:hypothetical protein